MNEIAGPFLPMYRRPATVQGDNGENLRGPRVATGKRRRTATPRDEGQGELADWDITLSIRAALVGIAKAQHLEAVRRFRAEYLPTGLLPADPEAVTSWIEARAREANALKRPPRRRPEARLGLEALAGLVRELSELHRNVPRVPSASEPMTALDLPVEGVWKEGPVGSYDMRPDLGVTARPVLAVGELFWLGIHLENEFGWRADSARAWVISEGAIPWIRAVNVDHFASGQRPATWTYLRHRVVIDAAIELPVARVGEVFASLQSARPRDVHYPHLARPLAPAILEATLFAAERNDGRAWEDVLEEWNARTVEPGFRYELGREGTRRFAKDVRRTYKALIGETLRWQRGPGKTREGG